MNILKHKILINGLDRIRVEFSSELVAIDQTKTIAKNKLDYYIERTTQLAIRKYLKGYIHSRLIAYKRVQMEECPNAKSLSNLQHYIDTYYPTGKKFYVWIAKWNDTLLASLPRTENASHTKIKIILKHCKTETNEQTRTLPQNTRKLIQPSRLGSKQESTQRVLFR